MSENKHLTLDERNFIEQELSKNTSFKEIAKYLSKDPTTISKEVRKHRIRKEGQSISHVHKTNDLPCTRATLYNYVSKNCFSARNIDLPRLVKMKKRKQIKIEAKATHARTNRTYEDFQKYIELHP